MHANEIFLLYFFFLANIKHSMLGGKHFPARYGVETRFETKSNFQAFFLPFSLKLLFSSFFPEHSKKWQSWQELSSFRYLHRSSQRRLRPVWVNVHWVAIVISIPVVVTTHSATSQKIWKNLSRESLTKKWKSSLYETLSTRWPLDRSFLHLKNLKLFALPAQMCQLLDIDPSGVSNRFAL